MDPGGWNGRVLVCGSHEGTLHISDALKAQSFLRIVSWRRHRRNNGSEPVIGTYGV